MDREGQVTNRHMLRGWRKPKRYTKSQDGNLPSVYNLRIMTVPNGGTRMAKMTPPPDDAPYRWAIIRLQQRIESSGMSISEYAQTQGFPRAPNTVYRWLRGEYPIPAETRRWLLGNLRLIDDITTTPTEGNDDG